METRVLQSYICMVITTLFWGLSLPIIKLLVDDTPPYTIGFFRFFIACLCFIPILVVFYKPLKYSKETYRDFFLGGLTGIFGFGILLIIGMQFTTAAQGSIIMGINPVSISLWAHILHKERLDRKWKYTSFFISFLGVIGVIGIQSLLEFKLEHLIGNLIIISGVLIWGFYSTLSQQTMRKITPFETTAGAMFFGTLIFGVGAFGEQFWTQPEFRSFDFWGGILVLGIFVSFVAFLCYFIAVKNIGATHSSIFINLVPIFGIFFSWLILEETIHWTFLIGLILIVGGILIINFPTGANNGKNLIENSNSEF